MKSTSLELWALWVEWKLFRNMFSLASKRVLIRPSVVVNFVVIRVKWCRQGKILTVTSIQSVDSEVVVERRLVVAHALGVLGEHRLGNDGRELRITGKAEIGDLFISIFHIFTLFNTTLDTSSFVITKGEWLTRMAGSAWWKWCHMVRPLSLQLPRSWSWGRRCRAETYSISSHILGSFPSAVRKVQWYGGLGSEFQHNEIAHTLMFPVWRVT